MLSARRIVHFDSLHYGRAMHEERYDIPVIYIVSTCEIPGNVIEESGGQDRRRLESVYGTVARRDGK